MKCRLITKTTGVIGTEYEDKNIDDIIVGIARLSSSREINDLFSEPEKLLRHCILNQHWSIQEMGNLTFEVITSRAMGREFIRHKSISVQEFCVTGDTLITTQTNCGRSIKIPIEKLYKRQLSTQYNTMSDNLVRTYDEKEKILIPAKIKEVFKIGRKKVYQLTLENGKKIKATLDHKFLTYTKGFTPLKEISTEDFIGVNGVPLHQSYDWVKLKKEESIENGIGLQYIADEANVSYHTIRKWLKRLNLTYTREETSKYVTIWNKGLDSTLQPMYGKTHNPEIRAKMTKSVKEKSCLNLRPKSNLYKSFFKESRDFSYKYRNFIKQKQLGLCAITNEPLLDNYEVDHIQPVCKRPDLAFDLNNLQAINKTLHYKKSIKENRASIGKTINFSKVKEIIELGEEDTYDLEVDHDSHNYIANGIVTHNSQRYAVATEFELIEIRMQSTNNRQSSTDVFNPLTIEEKYEPNPHDLEMKHGFLYTNPKTAKQDIDENLENTKYVYERLLKANVARESARMILPETTQTRMYFNGNIRSWISFLNQRLHKTAQKEIRLIAETIRDIFIQECPIIAKALFNFEDAYDIHIMERIVLEKYGVYEKIKQNNFKKLKNEQI